MLRAGTRSQSFRRIFWKPFFSSVEKLNNELLLVELAIFSTLVLVILICNLDQRDRSFCLLLLAAAVVNYGASIWKLRHILEILSPIGPGARYFFVPYVLIGWTLMVVSLKGAFPYRLGATCALTLVALSAVAKFQSEPMPDLQWRRQIAELGNDPKPVAILPPGWSVILWQD
jgi:hypothetical protein